MSPSYPLDDAAELPPDSSLPAGPADIEAELADHLECAATEARQQGVGPEDARQAALSRFGDVRRIVRQCWWIRQGDQIMLKSLQTALLALIVVGLAALAVVGWRWQRDFARQMGDLTDKLAAIADRPAVAPEAPAVQAPSLREIRGYAYVGDESKPAAGAFISVWNFQSGAQVCWLNADDKGRFRTGILPEGEYTVSAAYASERNQQAWINHDAMRARAGGTSGGAANPPHERQFERLPLYHLESGPIALQTGLATPVLKLDLALPAGEISWELSGKLADRHESNGQVWQTTLRLSPLDSFGTGFPTILSMVRGTADDWPRAGLWNRLILESMGSVWLPSDARTPLPIGRNVVSNETWPWPARRYTLEVWLGVRHVSDAEGPLQSIGGRPGIDSGIPMPTVYPPTDSRRGSPESPADSSNISERSNLPGLSTPGVCLVKVDIEVEAGQRTHVKLVLDDGFEAAVQKVLVPNPAEADMIALSQFARLEPAGVFPLAP